MTDSERDDLDNLTKTNGWLRLIARAKQEWGPAAYAIALEQASEAANASAELLAVKRCQRAVNGILSWPGNRVKELDKQKEEAAQPESLSRGGAR